VYNYEGLGLPDEVEEENDEDFDDMAEFGSIIDGLGNQNNKRNHKITET
jgi:hypothetical protein